MIKIAFYRNGFIVNGHANYDVHGKDIVCAAVSAVAIGSLNWFAEYDNYIDIKNEANLVLVIKNPNKTAYKLLGLLYTQLKSIEANNNYKPYISITFSENFLRGGNK